MKVYLQPLNGSGALAQLVEQWTENPCVPGSIPGGTTLKTRTEMFGFFCFIYLHRAFNYTLSTLSAILDHIIN